MGPTIVRGGQYLRRALGHRRSLKRPGRALGRRLGTRGTLRAHGRSAELPTVRAGVAGAHAHVVRRGRSRPVRGADPRVVLGPAPAKPDTRVANGVTLHLVDRHLRRMPVHELDEATALARGNLDIGDLTEALEEGSELVLGHIARETADEHSRVVGIGELVHLRGGVEAATPVGRRERPGPHVLLRDVVHHRRRSMVTGESVGAVVETECQQPISLPRQGWVLYCQTYRFLGVAVEILIGRLPQ